MFHSRLGRSNVSEWTIQSNKNAGRRQHTGNCLDEDFHGMGLSEIRRVERRSFVVPEDLLATI